TRRDVFNLTTSIDTRQIMAASRALSKATNTHPPRNKAIVGANAFAHESGIHQHGVLANRETYEIMKPEDVGLSSNQIVLGKTLADDIGLVDSGQLSALLERLESGAQGEAELWTLKRIDIRAPLSPKDHPVARIEMDHGHRGQVTDIATAPGALDAAYRAVSQIMETPARV
ncbi:MAG: 2-isopropylmalate synthase, partial [Deltaproteobacteria bacterium]|nr:2-isopropylmalate synthase [Deltaproteobacteria bacterium]